MKKILLIAQFIILSFSLAAQTDGISYQAVIIDPNAQEIPGVDATGNILPNTEVAIRFTIYNSTNQEEFSEEQKVSTDRYGMLNLMIGSVNHNDFTKISWDGTPKELKVEIDFSGAGTDYIELSRQTLSFVPYAYHRNITATGTLKVDGSTNLNNELAVEGPTSLNSSLDVKTNSTLNGKLKVSGATTLDSTLSVTGKTTLNDSLEVSKSPSHFDGIITVEDTATFNGPTQFNEPAQFVQIAVNGPSDLNGQVSINADMDTVGGDQNFNAYPLKVQGSSQGISIKVNGSRSGKNNYVSFWDASTGQMWGRIEGQTVSDLNKDPEYIYDVASNAVSIATASIDAAIAGFEVIQGGIDLAASFSSSTACVGLGACVTAPIPAFIISEGTNLVLKIANAVSVGINLAQTIADGAAYVAFIKDNIGVTYQSGSGDYAEWIPKENDKDVFAPGDIVGIKNGKVTKNTSSADKLMVISTNPIVLGNMPQENHESEYEKVAFMGQVPVKVIGNVKSGDYILPSILGNGFGVAKDPKDMKIYDYKNIVGVAWSGTKAKEVHFANVAIGINTNNMTAIIQQQQDKLNSLQRQVNQTNNILRRIVPGFEDALEQENTYAMDTTTNMEVDTNNINYIRQPVNQGNSQIGQKQNFSLKVPLSDNILYFKPTKQQLLTSIEQAKQVYLSSGKKLEDSPFWKKMKEEPGYKTEIMHFMEEKIGDAVKQQKMINKTVPASVNYER